MGWRMVTNSSDNIGGKAEVDTLFFGKYADILQKSWRQIICQVCSAVAKNVNLYKS